MASSATHGKASQLIVVGDQGGVTLVDSSTPLKRLNYFDGKLLRATDFDVEQSYLRKLVALSNQGLGPGVVYGFDTSLAGGDKIQIGPGLAIDPSGNVLLLQSTATESIQALIDASKATAASTPDASGKIGTGKFSDCLHAAAPPPTSVMAVSDVYVIAVCTAEALCGQQDVFGKLCEEACVTSTDRPYRLDGLVLRAIPLQLMTPFPQSKAVSIDSNIYLRSKIAHSWFSDEVLKHPHAISRSGLLTTTWCLGAGYSNGYCEVPLAVVARAGATTLFLDAWIARRERIDAPAKRYWQWKMMMRPWDVYLAQILQFQCQLADVLSGIVTPGDRGGDPCAPQHQTLTEAAQLVEQLRAGMTSVKRATSKATVSDKPALFSLSLAQVSDLRDKLQKVLKTTGVPAQATDRILINYGFTSTPSAAYLPILTGTSVSVNDQVRALLGDGLDLRFCIVRPDFVAHALEEAQHMERISLLEGLDTQGAKPKVDVLVPDGQVATAAAETGRFYEMRLNVLPQNLILLAAASSFARDEQQGTVNRIDNATVSTKAAAMARAAEQFETFEYSGAAHSESSVAGGTLFYYAGTTPQFSFASSPSTDTTGATKPQAAQPAATAPAANPAGVNAATANTAATNATAATRATVSDATSARLGSRLLANAVVTTQPQLRSSIWVALEVAQDPGTLARGETTRITADLTDLLTAEMPARAGAGASTTQTIVMRAAFAGELQVDDNQVRPGKQEVREITGVVSGEMTLSYREGTHQNNFSLYLGENVRILRTTGVNGPTFRIEWVQPSMLQPRVTELEVKREWKSATQAEALGMMSFSSTGFSNSAATAKKLTTRETFRAWQTINTAVREPNHPAHESAIRALRGIGTALGAAKFADLAARKLFPAPPLTAELTILATHDWVLFHRRRDKVCQIEKPAVAVDTRRYAVYNVKLTADQNIADIARLLQKAGSRGEGLPPLDFVQVIEFDAGIHAVATPHAQVQAAWRQDIGIDVGIAGGVVASRGVAVAEGERLAQERLESLVQVIDVVAPVDVHPDYAVLARVPDSLDVAGQDGIMVIATRPAVAARDALLIYTGWDRIANGEAAHFPNTESPVGQMAFRNNAPEGTGLTTFISKLTPNQPVFGVTVATTKEAPDTGAAARLQVVIDALIAAGTASTQIVPSRRVVQALTTHDRAELVRVGQNPDSVDEVIFFEQNRGE